MAPEEVAAERDSQKQSRQDGGEGDLAGTDDQRRLADPDELVAQAQGAGREEKQGGDSENAGFPLRGVKVPQAGPFSQKGKGVVARA